MKRKYFWEGYEYYILAAIIVFGFFLRVYRLGLPPLWIDESISAGASMNILQKGLPLLDSGLLYSRAYFFHYLQAFFLLFGQTDFLLRFVSVVFGVLTIVLAYFVGKEYSKSGGLISALFMAVFYLEVFYSRQGRFYQLFQLAFFASLYFLYKSKEKRWMIYPGLVSLFIAIDTQIAGLVLCPFFIIHILVYSKKWRKVFAVFPALPLIKRFVSAIGLSSGSTMTVVNYASKYFSFTTNMIYLFVFFALGGIWAFFRKKRLTLLILVPSVVLL